MSIYRSDFSFFGSTALNEGQIFNEGESILYNNPKLNGYFQDLYEDFLITGDESFFLEEIEPTILPQFDEDDNVTGYSDRTVGADVKSAEKKLKTIAHFENKPRNWLASKVAWLRKLLIKLRMKMKACQAKAKGKDASLFQKVKAKLAWLIDKVTGLISKLLKKIQHFTDKKTKGSVEVEVGTNNRGTAIGSVYKKK